MATSGTVSFDLSIEEIIEDAFERCGGQGRSGYDIKSARRSLNILLSEWGNRGLHFWEVANVNMALNQGQNTYRIYIEYGLYHLIQISLHSVTMCFSMHYPISCSMKIMFVQE